MLRRGTSRHPKVADEVHRAGDKLRTYEKQHPKEL
eukprot:COSAG02_NODE_70838_length_193_cov_95.585106_1_plen_34_part_10